MTEVKQVNIQAMIQIKRNNKVFFTLEDFGEGSKLSYQLMDHHYIILKFTTATPIYFEIGDSVEIPDFGYFELTSSYFPKHNDSDGYDYEMQMDAYYMSWKNKLCKYRPQHGVNETSFKLTTTVGVHMNVILGNLKALGLTYNGKEFSVDYTTYNNKAFDVQKRFLIEYGSISILDALNAICSEDALNCEWWIDGSIIYLGYCEMEGQTTFEQDVNVLSMSYSESKSTYITRLYAFGSDRNIPKGYFTGADADVTTDGVATDYLMLPNKEVDSDGFYAKDGYLENVNVVKNDKQAIEGVVMFDEEYPKVECRVSSIKTYDSTVDNEDGTKTTQTFWQVTSTDSFTNNFKESWIKSNLTLGIKFTSGALMGMEFDVSFKVIDKVNYFEIVANDTYGRTLPDGVMCPKVGDKYFLFNWDATKITDTDLIPTAQLSLFDRSKQYYQKTMISNSNFTCTMDGDKFYNDGIYDYHPLGEQVKLINDMFAQVDADGKHYRNSRIIGMEIPLDIPYDHPQYIVGEKAATSRLGKLEDKVDSIKVNGMQIGGTGSGNGGGVYVIGMNDTTPASDSNVYSARRSRMEFVSRLLDNTAKSTITWEKVQKFFSGLFVGNRNNENGGSWTPDAEGRSHLITDYLEVRMKAIFEELVINKTSTIGGKEIISPTGGVVAHKVEEVTVTYNNVSQKAYRCYFLAEQEGDAVDNDFAVGDQVRSESFNVRKGTYHKAGNHFYWRLVIGRDEDPIELEGKKYHYIDLSDTDCATASDVPAKGDVLNQCGNRTDVERQNCLIFSAVDTYSPSISLYHGINSYSFANREYVEYGVNKQNNKAFFHVYGDMYFGDRPTSANNYEGDSYVKYDSDKKKVTIKGDLDIKSTYDGKTLDKYIADKSLDKNAVETIIKKSETITDLQNQIDGAIETWFYDGVPTLNTEPASGWDTDMMKNHLGDLYYDNKTGKAYRFAKDGSTYKWIIITDTELTKAIEDSSQALKDAKSKRRIFGSQPVPPYDVNDMWVNATYPSDGSTYKNEILKCSTAKAEGEEFDIADWKLASKYTDDTKAEEAKKAAEKAQEEIKTTQSNLNTLGTTVSNNKKAFDDFTSDGYLDSSEIAAIAQDSKRLEDDYNAAVESYNNVVGSKFLLDKDGNETTYKTDLVSAKATLDSAKNELITYLSDIVSRYNASDSNGKATIKAAAAQKYTNFTNAYKAFYDKLGVANNYISSNLFDGLNTKLITNMAGLEYIKAALVDGDTVVKGGLILSTLIALRNDKGNVTAGINGADTKENGIAFWLGGKAIDKQASTTTEEEKKFAAKSLLRFDGTGYFANGNLWWDADGILHADPTSFIINKNNVGVQLALFAPIWKSGTTDTTKLANVLSIDPQKPFTHLDVSGNITTEGSLRIGGIYLSWDSENNALRLSKDAAGKEAANFYALGGITAYGKGAGTSGGGGLIASVISYARILEGSYTDADLTSIPNAYAIKALSSRIDNIASELGGLSLSWNNITGKPSTFTPSAHTHKWTEITDRITKVSQLTNDKGYLTAHQSLASYYTKAEIDAKGYTTNKGTVTSVALTLPTGLTCATKVITTSGTFAISLASGYSIPTTAKQTAWDGAVSAKHTHSNKSVLDGITSTKVTCWDSAYDWYALITTDEETADGVINKWNEVVSFLANIAQTDTLSGIVDGINKSISDEVTRAKKAEGVNASGISTNKTSITTLQGYFTSGSAKKALQLTNARKLWGNSFNGTADINGSIIVPDGKYISIGNIKMEYDATNKALKITNTTTNEVANLYTSGGVSAYGVGTSSSSGGGLNGSVKSYSSALKLTSESLSEIASAYSIKALDSRISSLEGGSAMDVSVSGSGNAVTAISKSGTTIIVTKGTTFLTSHQSLASYLTKTDAASLYQPKGNYLTAHQSLDGYVNAITTSGSGNAITSVTKSGKTVTFTKGATFLTSHQSLSAYLKSADAANTYLKLSGGAMTGNIRYKGSKSTYDMITFVDNNDDTYGNGICIGGGGLTIIGGGESASEALKQHTSGEDENMIVANDAAIDFFSNVQNGWNSRKAGSFDTSGYWNGAGFKKDNSSDSYVLLGGGGHKAISSLSVNYASSAGSASSVAWSNVSGRPTKLSQFTNDSGYITSSGSCAYATNADKVDGVHVTWAGELTSTNHLVAWEADGSALRDINPANVSVGNSDKLDGIHANGLLTALSNSDKGISITVGGTTKSVSNISVNYASSAGNADTVDGEHASAFTRIVGRHGIYTSGTAPYSYIHLFRIACSSGYSTIDCEIDFRTRYHSAKIEIRISTAEHPYNNGGSSISIIKKVVSGRTCDFWFLPTVQSSNYNYYDVYYKSGAWNSGSYGIISKSNNGTLVFEHKGTNLTSLPDKVSPVTDNVAASATRLQTARTIWGQSFDGTGNVSGNLSKVGHIQFSADNSYSIGTTTSEAAHTYTRQVWARHLNASRVYAGDTNLYIGYSNTANVKFFSGTKQSGDGSNERMIISTNGNVGIGTNSPAYKLHVVGDIYSTASIRSNGQNQAIVLSNGSSPAWISALEGQVIFNTGKAIRFGETAWDWNEWAGLKYNHSNKTIYLGIADNSVFNANSAQSNGTLKFPGITTITPDSGARIGGSGGDLYLGNANNSGFVKVQDMCSQVHSSYWNITQFGSATFKSLTVNDVISCDSISVNKNAVIAGNLSVNGLINNKGILPTDYDVNKKGAGCYVSADALCSGITAITDSIPVDNLSIVYTNDNGRNWTNYNISNDTKFKAYANVAGVDSLYLGRNVITGNTDAEKLAQIKKNELMFSFDIPNSCYSQVYFACVDIGQGVGVTCTVEYLNSKGVIVNTYIKYMTGWNQFNYINLSNGNTAVGVGNDDRRYIRFRFKHDQNTTALRNASINKVRIFSFTKYSFPTDRFMGHTGHIYNFDYNMNTYFPNSILAKGGVTAYQSSDIRLKQDLRKLDYLGIIKAMGGTYGFAWKKDNTRSIGWIAQHVLHNPQLKDIVETDEKGYYKINYWSPKLIATAFGAIEQVGDEVSRLKARVVFLESEVQRLSGDKEDCNKKRLDNKNINSLN